MHLLRLIMLSLILTGGPSSWAEDNMASNPQHGKELFESDLGCNVCHGIDALGSLGPNIRQVTIEQVYHAVQSFPDMINWQYNNPELFEEQALRDIVAYLQTLERNEQAK